MPGRNVSRRLFVGAVGSGVVAAPIVASLPITPAFAGGQHDAALGRVFELLQPLKAGARFARWTVKEIHPLVDGAVRVEIQADDQHTFNVEIMARDTGALAQRPPGETAFHAFFVVNGGDGWTPTQEEQGLAAMTLATIVERNEHAVRIPGMLTHAERLRRHADTLLATAPASGH